MACATKDLESLGVEAPPIYVKLASIGAGGAQKGNMHRDLSAMVDVQVPAAFQVELPMAGARLGTWKPMYQDVLLPHELFGYMWQYQPKAFQEYVQGPSGQIQAFWKEMAGNPQLAGHPIRREPNYQNTAIPIAIHGDGVPITGVGRSWSKSCDIYSWTSLLGGGRTDLEQNWV